MASLLSPHLGHGLHTPGHHHVSPKMVRRTERRALSAASVLGSSRGPQVDGVVMLTPLLEGYPFYSVLMHTKIENDLKYVMLNGFYRNSPGGISIYRGSLLHTYLSFEISGKYLFNETFAKAYLFPKDKYLFSITEHRVNMPAS